jgi:excisionase family DNA binding protein
MQKRLYTSQEAAAMLGISYPSIRRAIVVERIKIVHLGWFVRISAEVREGPAKTWKNFLELSP